MQQNVFISYRQADSSKSAKSLYEALTSSLPAGIDVFFDVADVDPGGRIPDKLRNALEQSKVVLVVIGSRWIEIGRKRFESENDLVRFELEYGLSLRRICVLPVLVDGAVMPPVTELPGRLKSLVHHEAVILQPDAFDAGVAVIADKIKAWLRPAIRIGSHRDVALLNWDYVDLLRRFILLDLEAVDILPDIATDVDGNARPPAALGGLTVYPTDVALAGSAAGQAYLAKMSGKDPVPLAATSRGVPYLQRLFAGGGVPPYSFSITAGQLPPELLLDAVTGEIEGKPRSGGEFNFTVQVVDANGAVATRGFTVNGDEGTPEDWARVFRDFPDTWRMVLNKDDEILGYWHVAPLHDRYLEAVKDGAFRAGEVTSDKLKLFHMFPGTYDVFFVIVALQKDYRIGEHDPAFTGTARNPNVTTREINDVHRKLFDSFFDALEELARRDVFVRELIADVWTELGKRFFEHFGMEEVDPCPREDLVAVCVGPIERILGKHAQRYPHLIERYREQMEGWNQELFDKAAGRWARKLQAWAGGVPLFGAGGARQVRS